MATSQIVTPIIKDIKESENIVICTPMAVVSIVAAGHAVLVEEDAGNASCLMP